ERLGCEHGDGRRRENWRHPLRVQLLHLEVSFYSALRTLYESEYTVNSHRFRWTSGFVDHPCGKVFQEVLEAFHVLHRELVFHIGSFEYSLETAEPNLARPLVALKGKMSGPHAGGAVLSKVEAWASQNRPEEAGRC